MPAALAILNPNQPGCAYPEKSLCGAAIALKLAQALLETPRLAAIAPAKKLCPAFSRWPPSPPSPTPFRCTAKIAPSPRSACANCAAPPAPACARSSPPPRSIPPAKQITGFDVAFRLAPRINAAGRMDVASEVIELFTTRDSHRAAELAAKLERLNRERRDIEAAALTIIEARLCDRR